MQKNIIFRQKGKFNNWLKMHIQQLPVQNDQNYNVLQINEFLTTEIDGKYFSSIGAECVDGYSLHAGITRDHRQQLMIVSFPMNKFFKSKGCRNQSYARPLWQGVQIIQNLKYQFSVYEKHGCTLQEYLGSLNCVGIADMHLIFRITIRLILKFYKSEYSHKSIHPHNIILAVDEAQAQLIEPQLVYFERLTEKKCAKPEKVQLKCMENVLKALEEPQCKKKVLFNMNPIEMDDQHYNAAEVISKKLLQIYAKAKLNKATFKNSDEAVKLFESLLSLLQKIIPKFVHNFETMSELLARILQHQMQALQVLKVDIDEIEKQACATILRIMSRNKDHLANLHQKQRPSAPSDQSPLPPESRPSSPSRSQLEQQLQMQSCLGQQLNQHQQSQTIDELIVTHVLGLTNRRRRVHKPTCVPLP